METQSQTVKENWIPLMDYAVKKNISVSTLRRHIKARKLVYKIEEGRYLILDPESFVLNHESVPEDHVFQARLQRVTQELIRAKEEIAELKTLIALYEETLPQRFNN